MSKIIIALIALLLSATVALANPTVAGETFTGTCPSDGKVIWVKEAPDGLVLGDDGLITWQVPIDTPTGTYSFTCKVKDKGSNGKTVYPIDVLGITSLASADIDPDGGTLTAGDVSITVPPGMPATYSINDIDGQVEIPCESIKTFALMPHSGQDAPTFSNLIEIGEYIEKLSIPSNRDGVVLRVGGLDSSDYSLVTYQATVAGTMGWRYVPSTISNGILTATLDHFSVYSVIKDTSVKYGNDWITNLDSAAAQTRVDAISSIIDVALSETDEDFYNYVQDVTLEPFGDRSCSTSAEQIRTELNQIPVVVSEFNITVTNTGVLIAGVSVPIPHYTVILDPINNDGPSYIVDRYLGSNIYEIKDSFRTDEIPDTGSLLDKLIKGVVDWQLKVRKFDDPAAELEALEKQIEPCWPGGTFCTLFTSGVYLHCPCPMHDGHVGVHCTIGTWAICPIHRTER